VPLSIWARARLKSGLRAARLGASSVAAGDAGSLVLAGGITVMGHETVQTAYSAKEIAPRLVAGFATASLSLVITGIQPARPDLGRVSGGDGTAVMAAASTVNLGLRTPLRRRSPCGCRARSRRA
jgi:hypothetical protein